MSAEERDRPRAWHQSPSMSELLASCAAADAVSTPPGREPGDSESGGPDRDAAAPSREVPRRNAA